MSDYKKKIPIEDALNFLKPTWLQQLSENFPSTADAIETLLAAYHEVCHERDGYLDSLKRNCANIHNKICDSYQEGYKQGYDDAIKEESKPSIKAVMDTIALEQESITKDDLGVDCISRQAVLNLFNKSFGYSWEMSLLKRNIEKMPSVTPQLSSGLEKNSKKLEKDFGESDCISRAEVLKLMQDNWHTHNGDWAMQESMDDIRALPAVTPIRPKGHWIPTYGNVKCSACGHTEEARGVGKATHYCSFCGADMREVVENESNND